MDDRAERLPRGQVDLGSKDLSAGRNSANRTRRLIGVLAYIAVLLTATGCASADRPDARTPPSLTANPWGPFADVQIGALQADETFASSTVEEWVKQVDFVAVIRIDSEQEIPPSASEVQRGEGMIGRTVTANIRKVVWSHPQVTQQLPPSISFNASGWVFSDGADSKRRFGLGDQPYLLPGHDYLVALRYVEFGCPGRIDPEDGAPIKIWAPLGSRAIVPFDGILGDGEFEGRQSHAVGSTDTEDTFRKAMLGHATDWVAAALTRVAQANPQLTHSPGPMGCDGD